MHENRQSYSMRETDACCDARNIAEGTRKVFEQDRGAAVEEALVCYSSPCRDDAVHSTSSALSTVYDGIAGPHGGNFLLVDSFHVS